MSPADPGFNLSGRRAMVSLGALSKQKYCTYSCPFCYVESGFAPYQALVLPDIIKWLAENRCHFDIVYVSGDTDSFAPPRTELGIQLLEAIAELQVDLLFTTRMVFEEPHIVRLSQLAKRMRSENHLLFGCVSIAELHQPHLEPRPIPAPEYRTAQLRRFKDSGIVSVLAMRPFLPNISLNEYREILMTAGLASHIVLGEAWYVDPEGRLESRVLGDGRLDIYEHHKMDFDQNQQVWKVFRGEEIERMCANWSAEHGIPFFMRSAPAVSWARAEFLAIQDQ